MKKTSVKVQTFFHSIFGNVRIVASGNDIWFCLRDTATALHLTPKGVKYRLDSKGMEHFPIPDKLGRSRNTIFINEANIYNLILDSNKSEAREFRNWVTGEVLPAIRKDGAYVHATADDTQESLEQKAQLALDRAMQKNKALTQQLKEKEALIVAQNQTIDNQNMELAEKDIMMADKDLTIAQSQDQITQLEAEAKVNQPNVTFALAVLIRASEISVNELAKIITQSGYPIGQNQLFFWLREHKYLCARKDIFNVPMQRYVEMGLFTVRKRPFITKYGTEIINHTTMVTPKGQKYFINIFNKLKSEI